MRYVRLASYGITLLGIVTLIIAIGLDLGAAALLTGVMLIWAGLVKIVVTFIWTHIAGIGTDRHDPIPPV